MRHVIVATATVWILVGLVTAAALALTVALARAHGRRLERRMFEELGRRFEAPSPTPAGPDVELRITLDQLLEQRDILLEEFQDVQIQIQTLKSQRERRRRVVSVRNDAGTTADIIVLHHLDTDRERSERRR